MLLKVQKPAYNMNGALYNKTNYLTLNRRIWERGMFAKNKQSRNLLNLKKWTSPGFNVNSILFVSEQLF